MVDTSKDGKLLQFLDTLGQDADIEFAKGMLEANDWNVEAAINMVVGGGFGGGGGGAVQPPSPQNSLPPDFVDEEGYRAPMRTGYTEQLIGPSPEEMVWEQAALEQAALQGQIGDFHGQDQAHRGPPGHHSDDVRAALRASQNDYQRFADQQEQCMMAEALQASYADYTVDEQRRMQQGFQDQTDEQRLMAEAIEASYREQTTADADYRAQMERVLAESKQQQVRSSNPMMSGRTSPTSVNSGREFLGSGGRYPEVSSSSSRSHPQPSLRHSRPSSGQQQHVTEVRTNNSTSSSATRQHRPSRGNTGEIVNGRAMEGQLISSSASSRNSGVSRSTTRTSEDLAHRNNGTRATAELQSRTVPSAVRSSTSNAIGSRQGKDPLPMSVHNTTSQPMVGSGSRASDHRPQAPGPLPTSPQPPPPGSSGSRKQTPPGVMLRPGVEEASRNARKEQPGLRPLNPSRVMTQSQADTSKMDYGRRRVTEEELERKQREEDERKRQKREAETQRQIRETQDLERNAETERMQRLAAETVARNERQRISLVEQERQRRAAEESAAQAERQRAVLAEQERRRRAAEEERLAAESSAEVERQRSIFAEQERQRRATEEAAARQRTLEASRLAAEADKKRREEASRVAAEAEKKRKEEAESNRRAKAEAEANAAAEKERARREAAEFEAENRRREAREAEELQREREEAEQRRREARHPEEKEKNSDDFVTALVAFRKRHKEDPDALATCLKTMRTYISNLAGNPHEPKFQRINMDNGAFKSRVAALEGSIAVLIAVGFQQEGTSLMVGEEFLKTKGPRLFDAVAKIDVIVDQLKK